MLKKISPILLILLVIYTWFDLISTSYRIPKEYMSYINEGNAYYEQSLYVKALDCYKKANEMDSSLELQESMINCYQNMGDNKAYINACLNGAQRYPQHEQFYEKILEYYSINSTDKFFDSVIEYKKIFPENKVIAKFYSEAVKTTYEVELGEERPFFVSNKYLLGKQGIYDYETYESKENACIKELEGKVIFSCEYDNIRLGDDGYFVQTTEGTWQYINDKGYLLAKSDRKGITDINGKASGCYIVVENGKYKLMNNNMLFAKAEYDYISSVSEGVFAICKDGKWAIVPDGTIDYNGDYPYEDVKINSQGYCCTANHIVVKQNGKYGIINAKGETTLPCEYKDIKAYEDDQPTSYADENGKYGYIYSSGNIYAKAQFEDALPYKNGAAAIKSNGKWGFIDQYGTVIIQPQYEEVTTVIDKSKILALTSDGMWMKITIPLLEKIN